MKQALLSKATEGDDSSLSLVGTVCRTDECEVVCVNVSGNPFAGMVVQQCCMRNATECKTEASGADLAIPGV